ncbi:MAG: hypothetical protein JNL98_21775 [Bryobacterales bacterium]|nr:hypothetical protein [Bryobacterales bacterium]
MKRSPWHLCAQILLLFLFLVNLYRAATQSITTDEAFTYNRSVSVPIPALWRNFDANDHVLHTLLCKVTTNLFGVSEFTLRMPALAGGVLYFWTVLALCRTLFRDGPFFLLAVASLTLNPMMLDYCSIARGYGMATALLLFALYHLIRFQESIRELWRMNVAGFALALGVAANLTVAMPGTVLVLAFAVWYLGGALHDQTRLSARFDHLANRMIIPGIVVLVTIVLVPMLPAKREHFYVGSTEFMHFLTSLVYACLWRPANLLETMPINRIVENALRIAGEFALPVLTLALIGLAAARRRMTVAHWWLTATVLLTAGLQVILHQWLGLLYPERRTGLYYVPLATLTALAAAHVAPRILRIGAGVVACTAILMFLLSWNVRYYDEWLFDAGTRDLMRQVQRQYAGSGKKRITASWPLLHVVGFYRNLYGLHWLEVPQPNERPVQGMDLYLLTPEDQPLIDQWKLRILTENSVSRVRLANRLTGETSANP